MHLNLRWVLLQTCMRAKTKEEGNKLLYTLSVADFASPVCTGSLCHRPTSCPAPCALLSCGRKQIPLQ